MTSQIFTFIIFMITIFGARTQDSETSHFYSFDQTKIVFSDEGDGEAVVLIHGFIVNASHWHKTALKKTLLDKGYRVIIPDLRGNGYSDRPQHKEAYQDNAEIQDLMSLVDYLHLKGYITIGYSRGSIVLAKLLTQDKRISKAVLGGMGIDFTDPIWDRRIAYSDAFSGRVEANELTSGAINYAKSINADLAALGFLQDHQPVISLQKFKAIKVPTLVIAGDEDNDNGNPKDLQLAIPNSSLIIVEGDHNNTYKQQNFASAILKFLQD